MYKSNYLNKNKNGYIISIYTCIFMQYLGGTDKYKKVLTSTWRY